MNYLAYHFKVTPTQPGTDILIAILGEEAFESFDTSEEGFVAYISDEHILQTDLTALVFEDFKFSYRVEKIETQNWNATWEANFEPVEVENIVYIHANFHAPSSTTKYNIEITPKMSFGTGHHDTTWQMCKALHSLKLKGKSVLDMGCGTGVLAILAKKMGSGRTLAIDIDAWSVENSIENCEVNQTVDIEITQGDATLLPNVPSFDIILANINKNILKQDMLRYFNCLNPGGYLLLSGFFTTDVEELVAHASNLHFKIDDHSSRNGWAIMQLKK
jgi:ribosomal protein L11 methyltransferase